MDLKFPRVKRTKVACSPYSLVFAFFFLLSVSWSGRAMAQDLTISTGGETGTSGTNWSISGNTLSVGSSGSATIHPSVITNHLLNTGDLTINLPWLTLVRRNININNTIAYSGSSARTLTFQSANDIVFANAVGITSATASLNLVLRSTMGLASGDPDNGLVKMDGINIDTKGGHFWVGGGTSSTTWNGLTVGNAPAITWLDDVPGISVVGSTIASGGGNIYMSALSFNSSDNDGVNYGMNVENSNISSGAGDIYFNAELKGQYTNGIGMRVLGSTSITSTSGAISILGTGSDQAPYVDLWRVATQIQGSAQIKSVSGNITVRGDAAFTASVNDKEGLNITDGAAICSQSGNITLRGTNTLESSGQYSNSIRFAAANVANSIRIGYDGTNAYSGNITIEGNSIYQRATHAGAGSIAVQTTGTLTIQPTGTAFTYMRAGDAGTLTFDDDWNFGTNLGGFTLGKPTNNADISFSNILTVAGPINILGGKVAINANLTSSADGDIFIKSLSSSNPSVSIGTVTINKSAGTGTLTLQANGRVLNEGGTLSATGSGRLNVVMWSDFDNSNNDGGVSHVGTISTNGGHVWLGGSNTSSGSYTWNGLTVGDGPSIGTTSYNCNALDLFGPITTGGGDVLLWASLSECGLYSIATDRTPFINAGSGDITFIAPNTLGSIELTSTGVISLVPHAGSYASALTLGGTLTSGNFTFNTSHYNGLKINSLANSGLVIGNYSGHMSGSSAVTQGNTSTVTASSALSTKSLEIYGGIVTLNSNLTTTASGGAILVKATDQVNTAASLTFTTNNGDFILWCDSDNSSGGRVWLGNNNVINTANGSTSSGLSGGGRIVLAGGLDNGANGGTASDGIPDGFAANASSIGVYLGSSSANYTQMYSGGGDILVRGASTFASSIFSGSGVYSEGRWLANAGEGAITIHGTSSHSFGINFANPVFNTTTGDKHLQLISDKATGTAISITGTGSINHGVVFNFLNPKEVLATGGGAIVINGTGGVSGPGVYLENTDILATSGDITVNGSGTAGIYVTSYGARFGSRAGTDITSSTSNIRWSVNSMTLLGLTSGFTNNFTTTGTATIEPSGTSFSSAVSYPIGSLTVTSNGLQLGKPGNTAAMTITGNASSNGPVTVHTGDFTTDAGSTLTATGNVLTVNASGNVTLNEALAGSTTTVNGQGNVKTIGTLTNLNLSGGNAQSITGAATLTNLTLNKSVGTTATITAGPQNLTGTLNLTSGTLDAGNGFLTLKSSATGTARVARHETGTGNVTGNVVVERFIPSNASATPRPKQWRMLAFPYSGSLQLSAITGIGISYAPQTMMVFSENGDDQANYGSGGTRNAGYQSFSSSSQTIEPGKGVATWIYGDNAATAGTGDLAADLTISSSGTLNESGADVVMTGLTHTKQGWHLIGNPFASSIDWDVIAPLNTAVAATIYRWDPVAANWTNYSPSGGGTGSRYIESGSAFFIKSAAGAPTTPFTLTIPQSAKATEAPNLHFSKNPLKMDIPGQRVGAASTLAGLRLKASGMGNPIPGEAYLDVSKTDATKGWDPQYDGLLMARSSGANVFFDGEKDNDYSMHFDAPLMNGEQRYYPITVTTPKAGETLIEVASEGRWSSMNSVALIDKQLGRTILMLDGQLSYKIRLEELKSEGRFLLAINHVKLSADGQSPVFEAKALGNPVTSNIIDLQLTHPTASPKRWRVVDAMGREAGVGVFATDAGIQHRLTVPGMRNPGVYVVQVEMDNGETQQLRILRN